MSTPLRFKDHVGTNWGLQLPISQATLYLFKVRLLHLNADACVVYRHLPAIGRFLIVVTFLEDALRIITQWSDQLLYLNDYRHSE